MRLDERVAKEVGKMIVEALGDRLWACVDSEIQRQLEATEHLYGFVSPHADGKFYASIGIYGNETEPVKVEVVLSEVTDYIGPGMDEFGEKMARMEIDGMRRLAETATQLADEAEALLAKYRLEQNKDRT
jgi:hypothetical protein